MSSPKKGPAGAEPFRICIYWMVYGPRTSSFTVSEPAETERVLMVTI